MKARITLVAAALAGASVVASAQMAPGLWEHRIQMKSGGGGGEMDAKMAEMQKQMASMPPDQRKMVEQMMASRGVSMGPQGTTVKVCLTKEDAERKTLPQMGRGECTQDVVSRTSSTIKVKWQCTGREPSSGEGEMNFSSDKAYTGNAVVRTTRGGKPETMNMEQSGKWLGADCGDVKPRTATRP